MATLQHPLARRLDDLAIRAARAVVASALQGVEADVVAAFDLHPELAPLLADGRLNALSEAVLALALRFAEEARVPVFAGSGAPQFLGELSRRNHALFSALAAPPPKLATPAPPRALAPVIDRLGQHVLGASWAPRAADPTGRDGAQLGVPALAVVVMGERCADAPEALSLLKYAARHPIFWVFVVLTSGDGPPLVPGAPLGQLPEAMGDAGPFGPNWCAARLARSADVGDLYPQALSALSGWYERWQRVTNRALVEAAPPEDASRNRHTRTVADERTQAVRVRAERERERVARTLEDVERGDAWPRARGPVPKGRAGDPGGRARALFTRPLVSPEWFLQAARVVGWGAEGDEVGVPALSPSLTIEGERPTAAGPTESSADRLARIRARRLSRHSGSR